MHVRNVRKGEAILFLDETVVKQSENVMRTPHEVTKCDGNPILEASGPWETRTILYGSVLHDPDERLFKMWYFATVPEWNVSVGYAVSSDGLHWHKPELDAVKIEGWEGNNLVLDPRPERYIELAGVIRHDNPPDADTRYVMVMGPADRETNEKYYEAAVSPDGVNFRFLEHFAFPPLGVADRACFVWDPWHEEYVLYSRGFHVPPEMEPMRPDVSHGRAVLRSTSKDLVNWSEAELVMHMDAEDPCWTEIYSMMCFPCGHMWVGLPQAYRRVPGVDTVHIETAWSSDGREWHRIREPFIPLGGPGEWDRFNNAVATAPVRVGEELWFYYSGRTTRHGPYKGPDTGPGSAAIGLATLRDEGFLSLDASYDGGSVVTVPLALEGNDLLINAKADFGQVAAEILDEAGEALEGWESTPTVGDGTRLRVVFPKGKRLGELKARPVRLRFTLGNTRLYSFVTR